MAPATLGGLLARDPRRPDSVRTPPAGLRDDLWQQLVFAHHTPVVRGLDDQPVFHHAFPSLALGESAATTLPLLAMVASLTSGSQPPGLERDRPTWRSRGIQSTRDCLAHRSWRKWMTVDRFAHPALVVVDMQNDFLRVGAPLEVPEARATIPVHQSLLGACREMGIPVIYTKFVAGPEPILLWEWSPVHAPPVCSCWRGVQRYYPDVARELDCSNIIEELYPDLGEPIVEKFGYGA